MCVSPKRLLSTLAVMLCAPCLGLSFLLLGAGTAGASQSVAHVYIALRALERASAEVKAIVEPNMAAYLAGSAGPDIAMATYYGQVYLEWGAPGLEAHYERTGQLITNMYKLARNDLERAFVLGWLTHYCTDITIHPTVSRYGGYYEVGPEAQKRHKTLEQFECAHVFNKWAVPAGDNLPDYVIAPAAVPARLINQAYARTYPPGSTSWRFAKNYAYYTWPRLIRRDRFPPQPIFPPVPDFQYQLPGGADSLYYFSSAAVAVQTGDSDTEHRFWQLVTMRDAFPTPPPRPEDYRRLMAPLKIEQVKWEAPDRQNGETVGHIVVTYYVNDLRLFKAFADDWDKLRPAAIAKAHTTMDDMARALKATPLPLSIFKPVGQKVSDPTFSLPDVNLETGAPANVKGYDDRDPALAWPGFPEIKDLLVFVKVKSRGSEPPAVLVPPVDAKQAWSAAGEWVPCPIADHNGHKDWERYAGIWHACSLLEGEKTHVWGDPVAGPVTRAKGLLRRSPETAPSGAGRGILRIPVDLPEPGGFHAELTLALADKAAKHGAEYHKKRYGQPPDGIHDTWRGVLGAETRLAITPEELVGAEIDKKYTFLFTAEDIPGEAKAVYFEWDFGVGTWAKGQTKGTIAVVGGKAEQEVGYEYPWLPRPKPECTLTVVVKDLLRNELAKATARVSFCSVTIQPRHTTYYLADGATEFTRDFVAVAQPEGTYLFDWDFGDGATQRETRAPGVPSKVTHTYKNVKVGDRFAPSVALRDTDGKLLASDSISLRIEAHDPQDDKGTLRVPNVLGLPLAAAEQALRNVGLMSEATEGVHRYRSFAFLPGRVATTVPVAGQRVEIRSTVRLTVAPPFRCPRLNASISSESQNIRIVESILERNVKEGRHDRAANTEAALGTRKARLAEWQTRQEAVTARGYCEVPECTICQCRRVCAACRSTNWICRDCEARLRKDRKKHIPSMEWR